MSLLSSFLILWLSNWIVGGHPLGGIIALASQNLCTIWELCATWAMGILRRTKILGTQYVFFKLRLLFLTILMGLMNYVHYRILTIRERGAGRHVFSVKYCTTFCKQEKYNNLSSRWWIYMELQVQNSN